MSYKVIIIEDEPPAVKRLSKMILASPVDLEIIEILDSVEDSINYLKNFKNYDLIFMDVQLGDGLSFDIFKSVSIDKPVIFTTAYDEYALQAFKVNSIDYLLKPIDQEDMNNALEQFTSKSVNMDSSTDMTDLISALQKPQYKHRFLVKKGKQLVIIPIDEVSYFYSEDGYTLLAHKKGGKHIIDLTMDQLGNCLDPENFHRINRKMIISLPSIKGIHDYFNSRLKLVVEPSAPFDIIVSRDRVREFKSWLSE